MKKLTLLSFVCFALCGHTALAQPSFNDDAQDPLTTRVTNYTVNPGCTSCWGESVVANPGDIVSVAIYYHNTSQTVVSYDTYIWLDYMTYDTAASHTLAGGVYDQNYFDTAYAGSYAYVDLTTPQTLTYIPGSVRWYPNQSVIPSTLLNGQIGDELFVGAGLFIGPIIPGWSSQGSVVVQYRVGGGTSDIKSLSTPGKLHLFPSVAIDKITVQTEFSGTGELVNMLGAIVRTMAFEKNVAAEIVVADLPRGMYIFHTKDNGVDMTRKIILQ